jgi:hypothetical protein
MMAGGKYVLLCPSTFCAGLHNRLSHHHHADL